MDPTREVSKISSQPEVDFEERDIVIPPVALAAAGFFAAWLALGIYVVHHPHVQAHLTRSVPMNVEHQAYFYVHMALLSLPVEPGFMSVAAVIMVWTALLPAEWSHLLLFSVATILSPTVILGGSEYIFRLISGHSYGSTMVCAGVITYTLLLVLAVKAERTALAVLSALGILYAVILPYYATYQSLLDIAGGLLFAGAIWCTSAYISERAGARPFGTSS